MTELTSTDSKKSARKPYVIGICGGSASGKTFLLNQLLSQLPADKITLISQDNYYKELQHQKHDSEGLVNFDHPDSVHLDSLERDLHRIIRGETVTMKEYTFNNPKMKARILKYEPAPIIILEGLFIFYKEEISKLIDLKIFVEADEHIRLARRLQRDHTERGYSIDTILRDYTKFVAPMYQRFVEPLKKKCDFIIPNNTHMYKAVAVLTNHLRDQVEKAE